MQEFTVECKNQRVILVTDVHDCQFDWGDLSTKDRMNFLVDCLNKEFEEKEYDAILALGDYSLDHWKWNEGGSYLWDPPVCNAEHFVKNYRLKLSSQMFMIPGNHEQYGNEKWKEITGYEREFAILYGDYVFLMLDTFGGDLDPTENSDGTYTGINVEAVEEILAKYPEKKFVLCVHDIYPDQESERAKKLVRDEKRILCAFAGHTHKDNTILLSDDFGNLPVFYCGDFSYNGKYEDQAKMNWGWRVLDFKDGSFSTEYICVAK